MPNSAVPNHLGLILDGNRRWAKARSRSTLEGHEEGAEVLKSIALKAFNKGVKYISAYIFSTENWKRTQDEVGFLMNLAATAPDKYLDDYHKAGIKILIVGQRKGLNKPVLAAIERAESKTAKNTEGTLLLCFNYGGQQEIADALSKLIGQGVKSSSVTPKDISSALYAPEVPPVDLLIRTSGEQRISGFMLWRAAYAELKFVNKNWPDFTEADLDEALADYAARQRRFGQ